QGSGHGKQTQARWKTFCDLVSFELHWVAWATVLRCPWCFSAGRPRANKFAHATRVSARWKSELPAQPRLAKFLQTRLPKLFRLWPPLFSNRVGGRRRRRWHLGQRTHKDRRKRDRQ